MPKLLPAVLLLLAASERPLREIAADLDVSEQWLRLLLQGRIKNPGVNTIERLYVLLSGKEIDA